MLRVVARYSEGENEHVGDVEGRQCELEWQRWWSRFAVRVAVDMVAAEEWVEALGVQPARRRRRPREGRHSPSGAQQIHVLHHARELLLRVDKRPSDVERDVIEGAARDVDIE